MWTRFSLTADEVRVQTTTLMRHVRELVGLADASEYLARAREELLTVGYGGWIQPLADLIDAIGIEIEWLATDVGDREGDPSA